MTKWPIRSVVVQIHVMFLFLVVAVVLSSPIHNNDLVVIC